MATLFPIPYLGSIANHYTVPYVRVWLPLLFILCLISLYMLLTHKKSKWHLSNAIIASLSLIMGIYIIIMIQTHVNQLGGRISF